MAKSWYAKNTWTEADRGDFFARLHAVPEPFERAACLRKQAAHLLQTGGPEELSGARELLDLVLSNYPDSSQLAYGIARLGECHERSGDTDAAFASYRSAIAAGRGTPRSSDAHRRFGLLAVTLGRVDLYDEAWAALATDDQPLIYPLDQYQQCGIKAIIHAQRGEVVPARLCALDALAATKHVRVDPEAPVYQQLEALVKPGRR